MGIHNDASVYTFADDGVSFGFCSGGDAERSRGILNLGGKGGRGGD